MDTRILPSILLVVSLLITSLTFTGCSSSSDEVTGPKEIPLTEKPAMDGPEAELFHSAKQLYATGYYLVAQEAFRSVVDGYPMGPYAEFSEIKIADCIFLGRDYDQAATLYEQFLQSYPSSRNSPYVTMQAALSYQLLNTDLGRDQEPLTKAVALYEKIIRSYPNSMYVSEAKRHRKNVLQKLANHEKMVADFYKRQGKEAAYQKRNTAYQQAVEYYGINKPNTIKRAQFVTPTDNVPRIVNASLRSNSSSNAVSSGSVRSSGNILSSMSAASSDTLGTQVENIQLSSLRSVNCSSRGGKRIVIELQDELNKTMGMKTVTPADEVLKAELPLQLAQSFESTCFSGETLTITENGALTVPITQSKKSWKLFELSNPARIIIAEDS